MNFVQLDRTFRDVSSEDDVNGMVAFTRELYHGPTTWERLIESRVVVVVAEARAGKSEECRQLARARIAEGKFAFFIPLRELAQHGLPRCFRGTESDRRFAEWLRGENEALFLLDSVDECRTAGQTLQDALQNLMQAVQGHESRTRVVITSRLLDWRWDQDPASVRKILASVIGEFSNGNGVVPAGEENRNRRRYGEVSAEQSSSPFRMVAMRPLNFGQVEHFCKANGLENNKRFLDAIEEHNAGDLASRPMDLLALLSLWKRQGRIGSLRDILEEILRRGLEEQNPEHRQKDPLSLGGAMDAVKLLAVALTMTKKASVLLPDAPEEIRRRDDVLAPQDILQEMDPGYISRLLNRSLFFEAGTGRVRLHRDIQDFLTAKWLHDMVSNRTRHAAESLMFRSRYGVRTIAPTLDAACAWVGAWDEKVRKRILEIEPDNLIRQGDPANLPKPDRRAAIDRFIKKFRNQPDTGVEFDINALKKFPVEDIADYLRDRLRIYRAHEDIRDLLLRLIWARKLGSCVDDVFPFMKAGAYNRYTQEVAVRAIMEAGTDEQRQRLASLVLEQPKAYDEEILGEVIQYLFPSIMSVKQLVALLEKCSPPSDGITQGLKHSMEELCQAEDCGPVGLDLLERLVSLVRRKPYWKDHDWAGEISGEFYWLCPAIGRLVSTLLKSGRRGLEDYSFLLEALDILIFSSQGGAWRYSGLREPDIQAELNGRPEIRRAHFWFQRAKGRDEWDHFHLCEADVPWLIADIRARETDEDKIAAFRKLLPYAKNTDIVSRADIDNLLGDFPALRPVLGHWLKPPKVSERRETIRREQEARQAVEASEHQKWLAFLNAHTTELANVAPEWEHRLGQVIEKVATSDRSSWAIADWRMVEEHFGQEVAEAVRDGCRKHWRTVSPLVDAESSAENTLYAIHHAGISGVNFERLEPDWPRNLSRSEAEIAARYALIDLNSPAKWLDEIHTAFPGVVPPLLVKQIDADWITPAEQDHCHTLTQRLRYGTPQAATSVCPYMLECLEREIPENQWIRRAVVDHLLNWQALDESRLAAIARREFERTDGLDETVYWMAVWLNVDAMAALAVLERHLRRRTEPDRFMLNLCNVMNTGERDRIFRKNPSYMALKALQRFLPLVYRHVRHEDDREHRGSFRPDARDDAERFRGQLLDALLKIRSKKAYQALLRLAKRREFRTSRHRFVALARQKAATDGDLPAWSTGEFLNFSGRLAVGSGADWHEPISITPGFAGVGLDLKKAWTSWVHPLWRRLRWKRQSAERRNYFD